MKRCIIFSLLLSWYLSGHAQITGYSHGREIVINGSQVSGSLSDFPVLISISSDNSLRSTANGGRIQNTNGWDIVFSTGCTTVIPHQLERYNPVTGELVAWIRVPSLNQNVNTSIYMYYGKTGITSNPSTDAVWDANYVGVYHLENNSFVDASAPGTGNNGTNTGTTNTTSAKIAGGRSFTTNTPRVELPTAGWSASSGTISIWGSASAFSTNHQYFFGHTTQPSFNNRIQIYTDDANGNLDVGMGASHLSSANIVDLNTNQWYYIVLAWSGGTYTVYVYSTGPTVSTTVSGTYTALTAIGTIGDIGNQGNPATRNESFDGQLDEVRISNIRRPANWILTEFRNQNAPSSFYTLSGELTAAATCALPINLLLFEAIPNDGNVKLIWSTSFESNNKGFAIERSSDSETWEEVKFIEGAGNSTDHVNYTAWDYYPFSGVSYYRLKQTDFDEKFTYSWIRKVDVDSQPVFKLYPNPSAGEFIIEMEEPEKANVSLYNGLGQPIPISKTIVERSIIISTGNIQKGVFHLQVDNGKELKRQLIVIE